MLLTSQIKVYQPIRCFNEDCFFLSVHLFYHLVNDRNQYFCPILHDLEQRLCRVFNDTRYLTYLPMLGIDHLETGHFVKVELVPRKFWEHLQRQVHVMTGQRMCLIGGQLLKSKSGLVPVYVVNFKKVGYKMPLHLHKGRIQVDILFRAVHIKIHNHLAFVAERFRYIAQPVAFFFCHLLVFSSV